ncbi:MAG TPA: beta-ketoacyl synthase N-terminal-like domain-containing protein [Acidobacteriota bacterium]|nr:beta-ketoacyl synthase N-terminal-like domain-containing protein [Acidobacteriota bacterium]HQF87920.1 beta-ketoacyl synthase N-terminal-like domain-containing protein [Acidobacteriota bacterium]HQG92270.1 beta-ketoacyl synthase N-terminal-like domain-containing protein [Acidobacteriota bacterium]HQK87173.1 beta-ketoacyl synthase N-terminal-like domain-containing protein [Acidobacteriota bacterium]
MSERVVITGAGFVSALGGDRAATWAALDAGRSGAAPVAGFDARGFACRRAAQAAAPDADALGVSPRDAYIMGRSNLWFLQAARAALAEAGLPAVCTDGPAVGCFAALGMIDPVPDDLRAAAVRSRGPDGAFDHDRFYADAYREIYPLWPLAILNNVGFCMAAAGLGIRGENAVFAGGADAGAAALIEAADVVGAGRVDVALAGGAAEAITPLGLARWHRQAALIPGDGPEPACRPFHPASGGVVPGEGAAVLVLEREASARTRGVPILAAVAGWGCAGGESAVARAAERALTTGAGGPRAVDVWIPHGEGAPARDADETAAYRRLWPRPAAAPPVAAFKGRLGHLGPAALMADAALTVEIFRTGRMPAAWPDGAGADPMLPLAATGPGAAPRTVLLSVRGWTDAAAAVVLTAGAAP